MTAPKRANRLTLKRAKLHGAWTRLPITKQAIFMVAAHDARRDALQEIDRPRGVWSSHDEITDRHETIARAKPYVREQIL